MHVRTGGLEQHRLAAPGKDHVADVDVVFPVALIGTGDVTDIGSGVQHQRAQVKGLELVAGLLQAFLAQTLKIDPVLPVGTGVAVQTAWTCFVCFFDKIGV